jgi:hypothetical protein
MQQFSLEASPLRPNDSGLNEDNVMQIGDIRLLRSKAIFGANGSGKSNLAKAIAAFQIMVTRSVAEENLPKKIWNDRFQLIKDWDIEPVFFQLLFFVENEIYRYGFQILGGKVSYEWLFGLEGKVETLYLMRAPEDIQVNQEARVESLVQQSEANELLREDSLYLTAAALNGNTLCSKIRRTIQGLICVDGVDDGSTIQYAIRNFVNGPEEKRRRLAELLNAADTGVLDVLFDVMPTDLPDSYTKNSHNDEQKGKIMTVFSTHQIYDWEGKSAGVKQVPFGEWESEGTGKLLGVGALVLDALAFGRPLVIDEFDARFHPNLTLKIVRLFQNQRTNPNNAQLIFVTHDGSLLRRAQLRRDQICLVNKDEYGISRINTLIEFKGVRKDASYEKEYLNGSYTAIPYLDRMDGIIESYQDDLSKTN